MDDLEFTLDASVSNAPISNEDATRLADEADKKVEERKLKEAYRLQQVEIAEQNAAQQKAELEDSRNKEKWGVGEYTKEIFSALGGGIQDTASSLITLPERIIDMATGEMAREQKVGGYTA